MKVLVVPDKFKGTLRAIEAAEAIRAGWSAARPADIIDLLPMSDGGDGFGAIIGSLLGAERRASDTVNAAHEPVSVAWWWSSAARTAVIESAAVIGLAMLPPGKFHPFQLDTFGLGRLAAAVAREHGNSKLILGIGGSATNDAGFGMARGLGFTFKDESENEIDRWIDLPRLDRIQKPLQPAGYSDVLIATDVQNPLTGPNGATRIYGPQKGMRPEDFALADACFDRITEIAKRDLSRDAALEAGAGAAGGLGYGLRVFLEGRFVPGFEMFAQLANLRARIAEADLIITGEGAIDEQSEMGKGTGAVALLARELGKSCIAIAGTASGNSFSHFSRIFRIAPDLTNVEQAIANPDKWLRAAASGAALRYEG